MTLRRLSPFALVAALVACGEDKISIGCKEDSACPVGQGCAGRVCIDKSRGTRAYDVRIWPPASSLGAVTEIPGALFSNDPSAMVLSVKSVVRVSVGPSDLSETAVDQYERPITVTLNVPSRLAGQPPVAFNATAIGGTRLIPTAEAQFELPADRLGLIASVSIDPPAPMSAVLPRWTVQALVTPLITMTWPRGADLESWTGSAKDALAQGLEGFEVTAWRQGVRISNRALTEANGSFRLNLPRHVEGTEVPAADIRVDPPASNGQNRPSLLATQVQPHGQPLTVGTLTMAPFAATTALRIPVRGIDRTGLPRAVPGTLLAFRTVLPDKSSTTTQYSTRGYTDPDGVATVNLIPGTLGQALAYSIAVIPPQDSHFSPTCILEYGVAGSDLDQEVRTGATVTVPGKRILRGQVQSPEGVPVSKVLVVAEGTGEAVMDPCGAGNSRGRHFSTTDATGVFVMLIPDGIYGLRFVPASGLPFAVTQEKITVRGDTEWTTTLSPGVLAQGRVQLNDGAAQPGSLVQVFDPSLAQNGTSTLVAQDVTDSGGRFRVVLPAPTPAP